MKNLFILIQFFLQISNINFFYSTESSADENTTVSSFNQRERWNRLPESEKAKLRDSYQRFKSMPEAERKTLTTRFEHFQNQPSQMKEKILKNYDKFRLFSEDKKSKIRERFKEFQKLSPQEKKKRLEILKTVRDRKAENGPDRTGSIASQKGPGQIVGPGKFGPPGNQIRKPGRPGK